MGRRSRRHKGYEAPIDRLGRSRTVMWIIADDPWGGTRESRRLEPGTDLFDVLVSESLRYHRDGWRLTDRPFFNTEFFITREGYPQLRVHFTGCNPDLQPLDGEGTYEREYFFAAFPKPRNYM